MKFNDDIVPLVKEILDKDNLLNQRKSNALKFLNKKFAVYKSISEDCIDLLNKISNESPQLIINFVNEFTSSEFYTTIITNYDNTKDDVLSKKITNIATHWEIASLYKFASFLLSNLKAPLESLSDQKAIFSHLKLFGFNSKLIDDMRIIRNAKNHKFTIQSDSIVASIDNKNISISFQRIDEIFKIVETFSSWWLTFITTQILYSPSYGFIVVPFLFNKAKSNREFLEEYTKGMKILYPDFETALKPRRHISTKQKVSAKINQIKRKILSPFKKVDSYHYFIVENKDYLFERLSHHSKIIADYSNSISDKLENEDDKQIFVKLFEWFSNFNIKVSNIDLDAFEKRYVAKHFK